MRGGDLKSNLEYGKLNCCVKHAEMAAELIEIEKEYTNQLKAAPNQEARNELLEIKKDVSIRVDVTLENALTYLAEAGGGDAYHYNYDLYFNRVVAGLMGSTCYMKDTFQQLQDKGIRNIMAIASQVEGSGHHSTFGHSHLTLEISGIPKALAMILNNEKEYCTSEKSARYTVMTDIDPKQNALYEKWKEILTKEIDARYGKCQPFFDAKGVKVGKLAQENARYMISVFTPSNMVYTTSFRQLNYLAHWFEAEIANPNSNAFYAGVKKEMQEFVDFVKDNNLYSEKLEDHKGRNLSMFGNGILKEYLSSSVYSLRYNASLACLAQEHRHRTINYHINEFRFRNGEKKFFIPPIIKSLDSTELYEMWNQDIFSVEDCIPQGTLVQVIENGETQDFILKAMERECSMAQLEINDITKYFSGKFQQALMDEMSEPAFKVKLRKGLILDSEDQFNVAELEDTIKGVQEMRDTFGKLSKGARCTAGYQCATQCGFKDGINMERLV